MSSASSRYGLSVRQRSGSIGGMQPDWSKGNNTPTGYAVSLCRSERTGLRRHEPTQITSRAFALVITHCRPGTVLTCVQREWQEGSEEIRWAMTNRPFFIATMFVGVVIG